MSGASAAFTQGYLADAKPVKRKDLDLSEIIELCALRGSQEERIAEVRRYGEAYPEFKYFLIVAYFYKDVFSKLAETGKIDYIPSKTPKGGSPESIKSMWARVCLLYDTYPNEPKKKRGIIQQLLSNLHADDADLIHKLVEGKYYRKELNEVVVAKAFPGDVPDSPKA